MSDCFGTLPRKIRVGSFTYRIMLLHPDDGRLRLDNNPSYAVTDTTALRIYVDESMERENALTVIIHELQHCINAVFGVDDASSEEHVATQSGMGWFNIWMENPKLLTWVGRMTREIRRESKAV